MTDRDRQFMAWWEKNRDKQKKTFRQLYIGLPVGLIFVIPIAINFSSNWYKRANMQANSTTSPLVLLIAMLAIVCFLAIFYKKFQWDQYEQRYLELKAKLDNEETL
jgi:integral membrane sensor domain MASE1